MENHRFLRQAWLFIAVAFLTGAPARAQEIQLERLGTYATGLFNQSAAEIVAHDPKSQRLFVTNVAKSRIDVLDIRDPRKPALLRSIEVAAFGKQANSVAVNRGLLAVAVEARLNTDPGKVAFFDADGRALASVTVGSLPDMLTFTPDGRTVLVANEGQPSDDYKVDPPGSVSIIRLPHNLARLQQSDVTTVDFSSFNGAKLGPGIRVFGPGASVAQDFEPEYIAVSPDSRTAWITLQENNAIAVLDIEKAVFTKIAGLGFKDHSRPGQGLDPSDQDGGIKIATWPVRGMYQPDSIAAFGIGGRTYLVTANEGDGRDYKGFSEERRVSTLTLDPTAFPNGDALKGKTQLGRLTVTSATGDTDGDGDFDQLYLFGARSFSIWTTNLGLVFDSGDDFEKRLAALLPAHFNSNNDSNTSFDTRSDNKGPEPEGVVTAQLFGRTYVFIGLERIGGVFVYDASDPAHPRFVTYVNDRIFTGVSARGTAGDLGPEGLLFIPASSSPIREPLLVTANEVSGTTTLYRIVSTR